jgi:hypothetical protein
MVAANEVGAARKHPIAVHQCEPRVGCANVADEINPHAQTFCST